MKTFNYILWDLDGTVTDSAEGILNSAEYALKKSGVANIERSTLNRFIGPPLWESFEKYYEFTKVEANQAVGYFREYYKEHGIYENIVYEGIEELLKDLKSAGKINILATSKAEDFAVMILDYFGISKYFDCIAGASMDGSRVDKADVIKYAFTKYQVDDMSEAVMVGDREHDMIGAAVCGIYSIGVLYGYGDREEFMKAGACEITESVETLRQRLLSKE